MKVTTEKDLRETIQREIKTLAQKAIRIVEEKKPDVDFDPTELQGIPKSLVKLLDPNISPQRFAALDAEMDEKGSPQHQAFALLAFALTYADKDVKQAQTLLKRAIGLVPKVEKMMAKASKK